MKTILCNVVIGRTTVLVAVLFSLTANRVSRASGPIFPEPQFTVGNPDFQPTITTDLITADLNGDGDVDLVTASPGSDDVAVLLSNGDGTFAAQATYYMGSPLADPLTGAAADLDGDNDIDLAVGNQGDPDAGFPGFVAVLLNNSDGTFNAPIPYFVGLRPGVEAAVDLDGDGDIDLAALSLILDGSVIILRNNGNGTFAAPLNYDVGTDPSGMATADLDGDGDIDLAVSNWVSNDISVLKNNGNGTFAAQVTYSAGGQPNNPAAADLDGDGDNDLAVPSHLTGEVLVLRNNGNSTFAPPAAYGVGSEPTDVAVADLDGDDDSDLAATSVDLNLGEVVSILLNNGNGTFALSVFYETGVSDAPVGGGATAVAAADLDGDGDPDLATSSTAGHVSVLLNCSDGTFFSRGTYTVAPTALGAISIASADLDGDGDSDLATANFSSSNVSVLPNNGDGTFAAPVAYGAGGSPRSVTAADLDGDSDGDLATANAATDNVSVLLNNGNGTFAAPVIYGAGDTPRAIAAADLDGDSNTDLVTANDGSDNVSVLLNNGDGTFAAHVTYSAGDSPRYIAAANLDGDGDTDLATANDISDDISVLLNNGDGTFAAPVTYGVGNSPRSVAAADLDGDGDSDLAAANTNNPPGGDDVSVLLNNGDGTFAAQVVYAVGDNPLFVTAADLDGDNDSDLVTANSFMGNVSVLLNNGDGTFADQAMYGARTGCISIAAADLDEDGDTDLATANFAMVVGAEVSVLLNAPRWSCEPERGCCLSDGSCADLQPTNCLIQRGTPQGVSTSCEPSDEDRDGLAYSCDNCPNHFNPEQNDCDDDGVGNVCVLAMGQGQDCNENLIPDLCDIAAGTSSDLNSNDVPDTCDTPCVNVADCADRDDDNLRDDSCVWWECLFNLCTATGVVFADVGGQFGACPPDLTADGNDKFHSLNCFSDQTTLGSPGYPCEENPPSAFNVDAGGQFGACCPDGVCDANDGFHALNAFSGTNICSCPANFTCPCAQMICPAGPMPDSPAGNALTSDGNGPRIVETVSVRLEAGAAAGRPTDLIEVEAFIDGALADLRGYQLHVTTKGGTRGGVELVDIFVDHRKDAAFAGQPAWEAFNVRTGQMLAGLDSTGISTKARSYLATFVFRASDDARGAFAVDLLHDNSDPTQRTFLFPTPPGAKIEIATTRPAVIEVAPRTWRSPR